MENTPYESSDLADLVTYERDHEVSQRDAETHDRTVEVTGPEVNPDPLSGDERAELERLRADKAKADAPPEDVPPENTHVLFLADGTSVEVPGQMTHYKNVPVVGAYPIVKRAGEK